MVDLTKRNLATEEDIAHQRDLWAAFFKATEWGEVMALAKKDKNISEAVVTLKKLSDDEIFKMRYQAREDMLRQELDMQYYYTNQLNEKDAECFLQALFGQSCKTFLDIIASPNWTKLQSLDWQLSCQPHSHCRPYLVVTA